MTPHPTRKTAKTGHRQLFTIRLIINLNASARQLQKRTVANPARGGNGRSKTRTLALFSLQRRSSMKPAFRSAHQNFAPALPLNGDMSAPSRLPPPRPRPQPKLTPRRESATALALAPEAFPEEEIPTRHYGASPLSPGISGTQPAVRETPVAPAAAPAAAEPTAPAAEVAEEDGFWDSAPRYSTTELQIAEPPPPAPIDPLFAAEHRALARKVSLWAFSAVLLLGLSELAVSLATR